jgi:hypothetical protein
MALITTTSLSTRCSEIKVGLDNGAGDLAGDGSLDDTEVTSTKVVCTALSYDPTLRYTFVTSTTYTGNLGGLAGAVQACNTRAKAGGLPGTYHPYLKLDGFDPDVDLSPLLPFVRQDGVQVAANLAALTAGPLSAPIEQTEYGTTVFGEVWTGAATTCTDFTSAAGTSTGTIGWSNQTDETWKVKFPQQCSRDNVRLYCMQDTDV